MNLYLISQNVRRGYDTYDSAVVAAESEEEARFICPNSYQNDNLTKNEFNIMNRDNWAYAGSRSWASDPVQVNVTLIGKAVSKMSKGSICSSFNAK
jgi:beta-N-acetylglucosaminidase